MTTILPEPSASRVDYEPSMPIPQARCPHCHKLLGYDVVGARFRCPRCKHETVFSSAKK